MTQGCRVVGDTEAADRGQAREQHGRPCTQNPAKKHYCSNLALRNSRKHAFTITLGIL